MENFDKVFCEIKKINGKFCKLNTQHSNNFEIQWMDFENENAFLMQWFDGKWADIPSLSNEEKIFIKEFVTDAIKKQVVQIAIRYGAELELEREFLYRGGEGADRYNVYKYLYKGIWYNEYEMNYHLPKNRPSVNIGIFLNFAQFLVPKDTAIFRIYGEPNPEAKKFITDILL